MLSRRRIWRAHAWDIGDVGSFSVGDGSVGEYLGCVKKHSLLGVGKEVMRLLKWDGGEKRSAEVPLMASKSCDEGHL